MVVFQIGHHFDARLEFEEHAIIFVRFDHKGIALARSCVDSIITQHTADNEGWIASEFGKEECDHGGGGGFAMRSSDGNAGLIGHELSEKIGALVNGDVGLFRGDHFDVVIGNGGRSDDPVRALNIARMMSDINRHANCLKVLRERREHAVRAGYGVSAFFQEAGDGGESASADADEVYLSHVRYQCPI